MAREQTFKAKQINDFLDVIYIYIYIYKKFLNILVNVAIKVVDKKGYLDLLFKI